MRSTPSLRLKLKQPQCNFNISYQNPLLPTSTQIGSRKAANIHNREEGVPNLCMFIAISSWLVLISQAKHVGSPGAGTVQTLARHPAEPSGPHCSQSVMGTADLGTTTPYHGNSNGQEVYRPYVQQ